MNSISRIRVNLNSREFEVEGSEDFIRSYGPNIQSFLDELATKEPSSTRATSRMSGSKNSPKPVESKNASSTGKGKGKSLKETIKINPNLNLRGNGQIKSFKDFFSEKKPKKGPEFNAISIYYLQEQLALSPVTLSDVYTCYKEVGQRPTENFKQALIDTKNKKGWIDIDDEGNLTKTPRGSILVEHDLPPATAKKSGDKD